LYSADESRNLKLRELKGGTDKGSCPRCLGKEDAKGKPLSSPGAKNVENIFLCKYWLNVNEEVVYRKTINCTDRRHIKNI
jgi:hypothetical protein